jgi:hypothetical protein
MANELTKKQEKVLSEVHQSIQDLVEDLEDLGPVSREFSLVLTKLEESEMWCQRGFEVKGYEPEDDVDGDDGDDDDDGDESDSEGDATDDSDEA